MDKLLQWVSAVIERDRHLENAGAAHLAKIGTISDHARGVERVVDHHLDRIRDREIGLSDFAGHIADSTALNSSDEYDDWILYA